MRRSLTVLGKISRCLLESSRQVNLLLWAASLDEPYSFVASLGVDNKELDHQALDHQALGNPDSEDTPPR